MDGQLDTVAIDVRIARIAERQHGVVGRAQLLALGLGRGAIESRLRRGWLHAVHRGVYAVGYRNPTAAQSWMAAVLACGSSAVLSHVSAAALWDLRRSTAANAPRHGCERRGPLEADGYRRAPLAGPERR